MASDGQLPDDDQEQLDAGPDQIAAARTGFSRLNCPQAEKRFARML
jgi:hypothetical protein